MIKFIIGLFIGGIVGVFTMCLMQIDKHEKILEEFKGEK